MGGAINKHLIACCDGTWNNLEQEDNGIPAPTNVFKIHNAIADSSPNGAVAQLKYYHPGVGGEGGILKPILGCGLVDLNNLEPAESWQRVHTAYDDGYGIKDDVVDIVRSRNNNFIRYSFT